jgi:hypothetical protein
MGRPVRHRVGVWDGGGSLLGVRFSGLCILCVFAPWREILDLDQRLVNQVRESLEQAVFVVWEMLGKDKHH